MFTSGGAGRARAGAVRRNVAVPSVAPAMVAMSQIVMLLFFVTGSGPAPRRQQQAQRGSQSRDKCNGDSGRSEEQRSRVPTPRATSPTTVLRVVDIKRSPSPRAACPSPD